MSDIVGKLKAMSELDEQLISLDSDARVSLLRREVKSLREKMRQKDAGLDVVMTALQQAYDEPLNLRIEPPKEQQEREHVEEAVLHLTDIHFGKETPTYNSNVAAERLLEVYEATAEITELRRKFATIDTLHLALGGDMVEGEGGIFPGQAHLIDQDLIGQMVKFGPEIVGNLILSLLQVFPRIQVYGVPGNHGQQRTPHNAQRNNSDSIFYEIVRYIVRSAAPTDSGRIGWNLPFDRTPGTEWYCPFRVSERWGGLLVHGDQIRGQLGFPWYNYGKKVGGWSAFLPAFDYVFAGHWHQDAAFNLHGCRILSTASPESDNPYAQEQMAANGDPMQRICFFNSRYGLLADHPLYLDEREPRR
jgi:hypothetical protein